MQRLLDFSRPRGLVARSVDVNALILGIEDLLKCTSLPRFHLKIELGAGSMWTVCDPHQLENTILGLVINARDAMPAGGTLTVKTEHADLATDRLGLSPGRYVGVCIADTGFGMSPEAVDRAFDPFYTTKRTGHRIGLGFPLAELFIERFRGHIGIDSVVGEGTHVWLYLPGEPV